MSWLMTVLLSCSASFAYVPEYSLITTHLAAQHGKNSYLIEQDVTLHKDGEPLTVHETWVVAGESLMRVTLEGRGVLKGLVQGSMLYEGMQKFFTEGQGVRTQHLGDEWLEPLFHFRNSKYFRSRMVSLKVAPPESLRDRAPLNSEGGPRYEPPGFLRLSRTGGSPSWAIGLPPSTGTHPTLWVEQDQFVIRKLRDASQAVMRAWDYNKYEDGFWFPRQRSYSFGSTTVDVQTVLVKPLGKLKPDDSRLSKALLSTPNSGLRLPDQDGLKEFYARFR